MCDGSENTVMEVNQNSQSQYWRYRYNRRLAHWKIRQDYLVKNITNCKDRIAMLKEKIGKYEEKLFEYESYMIVLNPDGEQMGQVRSEAAARLQEAIQEVDEEESDESDGESELLQDDDSHSVSTCNTVLEMRNVFHSRTGRK
jgi:predicted  nucleic acid-binding Zn-ribbon protein